MSAQNETWITLPSGNGIYEVSTLGRVRSVDRIVPTPNRWGTISNQSRKGRVLRPWKDCNGYAVVYLCGDGRREAINVHRLIAEAFCPKQEGRDFVNHIDGDKSHDTPSNLEWCTRSENMIHAVKNALHCVQKSICAISKDRSIKRNFRSVKEAAEWLGSYRKRGNISGALIGAVPSAYGYTWHYL